MEAGTYWTWEDAPQEYKKLSGHGGDEDWVVTLPKSLHKSRYIPGFTDVIGCWGEISIFT